MYIVIDQLEFSVPCPDCSTKEIVTFETKRDARCAVCISSFDDGLSESRWECGMKAVGGGGGDCNNEG